MLPFYYYFLTLLFGTHNNMYEDIVQINTFG
jgi:hypothetical protein